MTTMLQTLVRPHPRFTSREDTRRARLLAAMQLVIGGVGGLLIAVWMALFPGIANDPDTILTMVAVGVVLISYAINRSGHTDLGAGLLIGMAFVTFVFGPFMEGSQIFLLAFAIVPVLLTGIFFELKHVLGLALLVNLSVLVLALTIGESRSAFLFALQFLIFSSVVILTFIHHLNGLEKDRRTELEAMNARLLENEATLERRVRDRTRDLQVAADVSRQVATFLDLDELLPRLVERTRTAFDLYHVSVYLYDEASGVLSYQVGTGPTAPPTFAPMSGAVKDGVVKQAAVDRQPVLANDVKQPNPKLTQTKSELALPLLVGGRLVGVLDLQADEVNRFGADDQRVLTALAEQLAVAVQNARLYAQQVQIAEELRAVDDMKSQFLASMSHELRTPLNAILNFTEFVTLGLMGPVTDQQQDALNKSLASARHLLALINDVLDITKIEAGKMRLFVEDDLDLHTELAGIIATAESLLKDRPVVLVQDIDAELPVMVGDKRRVRQMLLNLVSNACKFTEEGSVTVRVRHLDDSVQCSVIDTGPGIAPDEQDFIFEPFRQTDRGIEHAGGTGLGLPITKRLVEAHSGRLWLESEVGQGSSFHLTLPVRNPALMDLLPKESAR